jgi:hypothetical protein
MTGDRVFVWFRMELMWLLLLLLLLFEEYDAVEDVLASLARRVLVGRGAMSGEW